MNAVSEDVKMLVEKELEAANERFPQSYNQKRTVTMTYENLLNMVSQRRGHKLDEWHDFCDWVFTLPYAEELLKEGLK